MDGLTSQLSGHIDQLHNIGRQIVALGGPWVEGSSLPTNN